MLVYWSFHLISVLSFLSFLVSCVFGLFFLYVVPMNSSSFSCFKTSGNFLKRKLNGKSLGLEVRGKGGSLRLWLRERFWRRFWCIVDQMWSPKEGAAKQESNIIYSGLLWLKKLKLIEETKKCLAQSAPHDEDSACKCQIPSSGSFCSVILENWVI